MRKSKRRTKNLKRRWIVIGILAVALIVGWFWHNSESDNRQASSDNSQNNPQAGADGTKKTDFDKNRYSLSDSASLWAIVNKGRILPSGYSPDNLVTPSVPLRLTSGSPEMHMRSDAAAAIEELVQAAKNQNINLTLVSGYRSYADQQAIYNRNVASQGQAEADASSARPGHSEHQTGLAADLGRTDRKCELEACFGETNEGQWLAQNAYRYGFIIRYQKDKTELTGYEYEPWHIRYVGKELAEQVHISKLTLEQFFGLPTYDSYLENPIKL